MPTWTDKLQQRLQYHEGQAAAYRAVLADMNGHLAAHAQQDFPGKLAKAVQLRQPAGMPARRDGSITLRVLQLMPATGTITQEDLAAKLGGSVTGVHGLIDRGWIKRTGRRGRRRYTLTAKGRQGRETGDIRQQSVRQHVQQSSAALRELVGEKRLTLAELQAAAVARNVTFKPQAIGAAVRNGFLLSSGSKKDRRYAAGPTGS